MICANERAVAKAKCGACRAAKVVAVALFGAVSDMISAKALTRGVAAIGVDELAFSATQQLAAGHAECGASCRSEIQTITLFAGIKYAVAALIFFAATDTQGEHTQDQ